MNKVPAAVLEYLRTALNAAGGKQAQFIENLDDHKLLRMMFANYRGEQARGMRLTNFGLQLMKSQFQYYEVRLPEVASRTSEVLWLDRRATMPYHLQGERLILFESELGMKLKLADGDIRTLMEIESA